MENNWKNCKNILVIRPDNMGDLIMSGPAIRALKKYTGARITVLTSSMATGIINHLNDIDEVITFDLPWVKNNSPYISNLFTQAVHQLTLRAFDAAVIFTVYSQNPLPAVMLAYMAGIPKRLAYCRENPYLLLTDWVPEKEPYCYIKHQVRRDLDLVASVGAVTGQEKLSLTHDNELWPTIEAKLVATGLDAGKKWLIVHAGVSEIKREYPAESWIEAGKKIVNELNYQIILTGSASEKHLTDRLQAGIGSGSCSAGGLFSLAEFITLISKAPVMVSVNTGTVHIAAALGIPVVVLYALTNPQHTPWQVPCKVLPLPVAHDLHSKNEVIRHVNRYLYSENLSMPGPDDIITAIDSLLVGNHSIADGTALPAYTN